MSPNTTLSLSVSSSSSSDPSWRPHDGARRAETGNATVRLYNSDRSMRFSRATSVISALAHLHPTDDFAIGADTAQTALSLLGQLRDRLGEPPRLMPFDETALVLTWDFGSIKRYLTVDGEDMHILDLQKISGMRCETEIDMTSAQSREKWLYDLAGSPTSKSSED